MGLRAAYRLLAPFYDLVAGPAFAAARARSLAPLSEAAPCTVLLAGVGTGLDLPLLPARHRYVGVDLSRAMLRRAPPRAAALDLALVEGDAQCLPFGDASFDCVVLHLIVAVVPDAGRCLAEAERVLRPHGRALVLDKFLRRGDRAWLRRALNPVARRIATRTDLVFEDALAAAPRLAVRADVPALAGGWFRLIELERIPD